MAKQSDEMPTPCKSHVCLYFMKTDEFVAKSTNVPYNAFRCIIEVRAAFPESNFLLLYKKAFGWLSFDFVSQPLTNPGHFNPVTTSIYHKNYLDTVHFF